MALAETRRAIEHYEQVLSITREVGDRRGEGTTLNNLGGAYVAIGENHRAIEHEERSLAIAREIGDPRGEGNALNNLGAAYAAIGDTRRAIAVLGEALVIFDAIEMIPQAAQVRAKIEDQNKKRGA
jgi:tetratricopeptide (TPR) repeat protein